MGEAGHHSVDDDHRRHAERHADDACQRDPAGAEIAPAEEERVHRGAGEGGFVWESECGESGAGGRRSTLGLGAVDGEQDHITD